MLRTQNIPERLEDGGVLPAAPWGLDHHVRDGRLHIHLEATKGSGSSGLGLIEVYINYVYIII